MARRATAGSVGPNDLVEETALAEDLIEHDLDVMGSVPIAMAVEASRGLQDAVQLDAPRPHEVEVGRGGRVAVGEGAFLPRLAARGLRSCGSSERGGRYRSSRCTRRATGQAGRGCPRRRSRGCQRTAIVVCSWSVPREQRIVRALLLYPQQRGRQAAAAWVALALPVFAIHTGKASAAQPLAVSRAQTLAKPVPPAPRRAGAP